ncbi:MAG: hypothetical protein H7Y13_13030 [Sphingobacteriaceae bacterium]|nr:hypothetical protein [Sphingobacteriaceae bacterium]
MKQTTKVLLPVGLFMSIVIPLTVKSLFTETDFFESDENSKIDFLQPYKSKPEAATSIPQLAVDEDGTVRVVGEVPSQTSNSANTYESKSSVRGSRERKLNMPSSLTPSPESSLSEVSGSTDISF